jgi:VanZ family protein
MTKKAYIIISWILVVACMGMIFYMSAQPAVVSQETSDTLLSKIMDILGIELSSRFIRKLAHATEFCILSILLANAIKASFNAKYTWILSFVITSLYGISDELHQLFVEGRACQFKDMLIDSLGALAGVIIWLIILRIIKAIKERGTKNGNSQTI